MSKTKHSQERCRKIADNGGGSLLKKKTLSSHKVRLIDLCPEEKAKVGELMQLMDREREANAQQLERIKNFEQAQVLLKERVEELTGELSKKQREIADLSDRLGKMSEIITAKDVEMEELTNLYERYMNRSKSSATTQTSIAHVATVAVQTDNRPKRSGKSKRHASGQMDKGVSKHRNIKIQTEEDDSVVMRERKHSKSFERIMRTIGKEGGYSAQNANNVHKLSKDREDNADSRRVIKTFDVDSENYKTLDQQSEEDDVTEMARAWNTLKQTKLSMKKSPARPKKSKNVDFEQSPERLVSINKLSDLEYSEKDTSPTKLLEVYNQLRSLTKEKQLEFDETELNRMLKQTDFQARKALQSVRASESSQHKHSKLDFYDSHLLNVVGSTDK